MNKISVVYRGKTLFAPDDYSKPLFAALKIADIQQEGIADIFIHESGISLDDASRMKEALGSLNGLKSSNVMFNPCVTDLTEMECFNAGRVEVTMPCDILVCSDINVIKRANPKPRIFSILVQDNYDASLASDDVVIVDSLSKAVKIVRMKVFELWKRRGV